ncbi:MAG: hypothetical protein CL725_08805 [Chloroflexi bacterium]|nr:hypothetical protein [Chloroflexota bacterium]
MDKRNGAVRGSVVFDAIVIALIPLALNALRLLSPEGSKAPAVGLLLLLLTKNLLLLPAVSLQHQRRLYQVDMRAKLDLSVVGMLALYLTLMAISIARALGSIYTLSNTIANMVLALGGFAAIFTAFLTTDTRSERLLLLRAAPVGIALLVFANILGYFVGYSAPPIDNESRLNQTLALFGLQVSRAYFPLSFGTNAFGAIAAVGALSSLLFFPKGRGVSRLFGLVCAGVCLVGLIMVDTRGALVGFILVMVFAKLNKRFPALWRLPANLAFLSPVIPFILYNAFNYINSNALFGGLVRSGSQGASLGVGTGRQYIWAAVGREISEPSLIHAIGYGAFGQVSSRVSLGYAWVFNKLGLTDASVHNAALQAFLDMGYVGLFVWTALGVLIFRKLGGVQMHSDEGGWAAALIAALLLLLVMAQTEAVVTIYTPELLFFFSVVVVAASTLTVEASRSVADDRLRTRGAWPTLRLR